MSLSNKKQNESCEAAPPLSLSYVPAQHILVMFDYTLRQHLNMAFTLLNEEAILADFLDIEILKSHFFSI